MSTPILIVVDKLAEIHDVAVTGAVTPSKNVAHALHPITGPVTAPNPLFEPYLGAVTATATKPQIKRIQPETPHLGRAAGLALQADVGRFRS